MTSEAGADTEGVATSVSVDEAAEPPRGGFEASKVAVDGASTLKGVPQDDEDCADAVDLRPRRESRVVRRRDCLRIVLVVVSD